MSSCSLSAVSTISGIYSADNPLSLSLRIQSPSLFSLHLQRRCSTSPDVSPLWALCLSKIFSASFEWGWPNPTASDAWAPHAGQHCALLHSNPLLTGPRGLVTFWPLLASRPMRKWRWFLHALVQHVRILVRPRVQSCPNPTTLSAEVSGETHSPHDHLQGAALGTGVRGPRPGLGILIPFVWWENVAVPWPRACKAGRTNPSASPAGRRLERMWPSVGVEEDCVLGNATSVTSRDEG